MTLNFITETGQVREKNEDTILILRDNNMGLFAVADGMGGHSNGKLASEIAIQVLSDWWMNSKYKLVSEDEEVILKELKSCMNLANDRIMFISNEQGCSMGTTMSVSLIIGRKMYIIHAGDSRIYLYRNKTLTQWTEDDTKIYNDYKNGLISYEKYSKLQNDSPLMKCLGFIEDLIPQFYVVDLKKDDLIFLCSDGVHYYYHYENLSRFLADFHKSKEVIKMNEMVYNIMQSGARDNFSAILVRV